MPYIKAYQAYQQQKYDECLKFLDQIKQTDEKKLDLLAQTYFQKKEYQKAYDFYTDLIDRGGQYKVEREENVACILVCSQLEQPGVLKTKPKDKLPTLNDIIEGVDQIELKQDTEPIVTVKVDAKKRPKRQKKKIRLPKNYEPNSEPDPERWLPRRDRKGTAHKHKKRRPRPNTNKKGKSKR